jgi:hypothetical protein
MNVESAAEYFGLLTCDVAKDASDYSAEIA